MQRLTLRRRMKTQTTHGTHGSGGSGGQAVPVLLFLLPIAHGEIGREHAHKGAQATVRTEWPLAACNKTCY